MLFTDVIIGPLVRRVSLTLWWTILEVKVSLFGELMCSMTVPMLLLLCVLCSSPVAELLLMALVGRLLLMTLFRVIMTVIRGRFGPGGEARLIRVRQALRLIRWKARPLLLPVFPLTSLVCSLLWAPSVLIRFRLSVSRLRPLLMFLTSLIVPLMLVTRLLVPSPCRVVTLLMKWA